MQYFDSMRTPSTPSTSRSQKTRDVLDVLGQFRVVISTIRNHYSAIERQAHVSGAQLWALAEVAGRPGMLVGELAQALGVHQSTVSNLLNRPEELGLLVRRRGRDQRQVRLYSSKKGLRVLRSAPQPPIGVLQQALSELPAARLKALQGELANLIRLMHVKTLRARRTPLSEM